ncbi:MAG: DUF349 domain-containing protein [Pseudomonadota bacterium]
MFRQIFGSKLQSPEPELRLQAVDELDVDDPRLADVALRDAAAAVRRAALAKLNSLEVLSQAAEADVDSQTRAHAKQRLVEVLCTAAPSAEAHSARAACMARFAGAGDASLVEAVLTQASDPPLRAAALALVTKQALLAQVAATDPAGQLRSAALERVEEESLLEEIARSARNRDKGVARLARERADAARLARERAEEADRLCSEIDRLAESGLDAVDTAAYLKVDQEWERWASADEHDFTEARARYAGARARIQASLTGRAEARRRADDILAMMDRETTASSAQIGATEIASLREQWRVLSDAAGPDYGLAAFDDAATRLEAARAARVEDQRRAEILQTWLAEREGQGEVIDACLASAWEALDKPKSENLLNPLAARYHALHPIPEGDSADSGTTSDAGSNSEGGVGEETAKQGPDRAIDPAELAKRLDQLAERLDQADAHIAAGELKPATAAFDAARVLSEQLGKARGNATIRSARERLASTGPKLNELRSWRRWSTDRARERLCDEVEQLLTSEPQDPAALARTIRGYRENWKKLDKTEGGATKALWGRFNTACTKAYEPCRKHFAAEADQRNANLALKVALVERLESLAVGTDWEGEVDWRGLDKAIGQFRREWRGVGPVNRRDNKPLMARHDKIRAVFDGRLVPIRERELERRRQVVKALTELSERDDLRGAADQAKRAQADWSPLVRGPRKVEQALWTDFRAACDRIFERLREQREVAQGARDDALKSAQQACEQIETLATQLASLGFRDDDRGREDSLVRAYGEARKAYADAGEVPRAKEGALKARYRKACDGVDATRRQRRDARQLQGLSALAERAALAAQLEQAVLANVSDLAERADSVSSQWDALEDTADKGLGAVVTRYERALACARGDEAAAQTLRNSLADTLRDREQLCLELEIATGVDSPAHLKAQRMAFQIDRLQASMSGTDKPSSAQIEGLLRRWHGLGAVAARDHESLEARFGRVSAAAHGAKRR